MSPPKATPYPAELGTAPSSLRMVPELAAKRVSVNEALAHLTQPREQRRIGDKEAAAAGRGSFSLDGKMIDIPVVVRAGKLLKRFDAIKAREARTLAAMKD